MWYYIKCMKYYINYIKCHLKKLIIVQTDVCFYFRNKFIFSKTKGLHNSLPDLALSKTHYFKLEACPMYFRRQITSWSYGHLKSSMDLVPPFTGERIWTSLFCKVALLVNGLWLVSLMTIWFSLFSLQN